MSNIGLNITNKVPDVSPKELYESAKKNAEIEANKSKINYSSLEEVKDISIPVKKDNLAVKKEFLVVPSYTKYSKHNDIVCDFVDSKDNSVNTIPRKMEFFYVNGINTTKSDSDKTKAILEKILDKSVTQIYNPTEGMLKDGVEAVQQLLTDSASNRIDHKAADVLYSSIKKGNGLKVIAHSQGAAITANALNECKKKLLDDGLSKNEVSKIMSNCEVVTLGGFTSLEDFPKEVKVLQMNERKDPVPAIAYNPIKKTSDDYAIDNSIDIRKLKSTGNVLKDLSILNDYNSKSRSVSANSLMAKTQRTCTSLVFTIKETCQGAISFSKGIDPISYHNIDANYLNSVVVKDVLKSFSNNDLSNIDSKKINDTYKSDYLYTLKAYDIMTKERKER
jgi:hypothetical protein